MKPNERQKKFHFLGSLVSLVTLLYLALMALVYLPGKRVVQSPVCFIVVATALWLYYIYQTGRHREKKQVKDITTVAYLFLIIWELVTKTFNIALKVLFPAPEDVFNVFYTERELMFKGIFSSMYLLLVGMGIALVLGNLLGLFVGWNKRLNNDLYPVAKVLSPIPPTIYTPYLIALLPTFSSASIAVIAFGLFWPIFMSMINNVGSMDRRIIDSARAMGVNTPTMLLSVILPYSIPGIVGGLRVQLSVTFMILMMAEMIGAESGLGFFIKKYSDYADYTSVLAGIILVGVVITILNSLLTVIENKTIKWKTV
jgi:NitT/TauT family transport system permease protein